MNTFWKADRGSRNKITVNVLKNFDFSALTQSMWALDAEDDFETNTELLNPFMSQSGPGVLQNYETHIHSTSLAPQVGDRLKPRALYALKHTLKTSSSVVGPNGIPIVPASNLDINDMFGGNALWQASAQAGYYSILTAINPGQGRNITTYTFNSSSKEPFYNSYDDYADLIRFKAKGYSVIPEYNISDYYDEITTKIADVSLMGQNSFNKFVSSSSEFLQLTGGVWKKSVSIDDEAAFYSLYSFSDFMGEDLIRILDDHAGEVNPSKIKMKATGIIKFLPYDGFYPADRTVQIAEEFKESFSKAMSYDGSAVKNSVQFRTLLTPFYSPGIMYNTIKSGIAVDFPIFTASFGRRESTNNEWMIFSGALTGTVDPSDAVFHYRVPFEAILNPKTYVGGMPIVDIFAHPSASFNCTGTLDSSGIADDKYRMMIENFCGEVPNFFLRGMTTIRSAGDDQFGSFVSGSTYGMRVKVYRSTTGSKEAAQALSPQEYPHEKPQDPIAETFTMYSRPSAFGPAVAGVMTTNGTETYHGQFSSVGGYNFPFTPPYYHGEAWADIIYSCDKPNPSVDDIISDSTVTCWRVDPANWPAQESNIEHRGLQSKKLVNSASMSLTSSFNIFGTGLIEKIILGSNVARADSAKQWIISPKFETPMLNFKNVSVSSPLRAPESVPRGMWHQYGVIPTGSNEGIFMQIGRISTDWGGKKYNNNRIRPLAPLIGMEETAVRLGECRDTKEIKEAIVIVPFVEESGERSFINIDRNRINSALGDVSALYPAGDSIQNMVSAMQRYYIPPSLDFISDETIDPIAMYFFEFSHTLTKEDLYDIWQNLPPRIGREFVEQEVTIEHEIDTSQLLGDVLKFSGEVLSTDFKSTIRNLRFMVFKVKFKAETSYGTTVYTAAGSFAPSTISKARMNWPYDFFSLVEYAKIDFGLQFGTPGTQQAVDQRNTTGLPSKGKVSTPSSLREDRIRTKAFERADVGTRVVTDTSRLTGEGFGGVTERAVSTTSRVGGTTVTTEPVRTSAQQFLSPDDILAGGKKGGSY